VRRPVQMILLMFMVVTLRLVGVCDAARERRRPASGTERSEGNPLAGLKRQAGVRRHWGKTQERQTDEARPEQTTDAASGSTDTRRMSLPRYDRPFPTPAGPQSCRNRSKPPGGRPWHRASPRPPTQGGPRPAAASPCAPGSERAAPPESLSAKSGPPAPDRACFALLGDHRLRV
jgi:hypothetical protein